MARATTRVSVLRRAAGVLVVIGFLTVAVVFYRLAPALPRSAAAEPGPSTTASGATPGPATTTAAGGSPTPTDTGTPAAPSATPPSPGGPAGLPAGPGNTRPGILLIASPMSDGTFDISEMVVFDTPVPSLTLTPPDVAITGPGFRSVRPRASSVQVTADNQPAVVPGGRVASRVSVPLAAPASRVELRYTLSGVTVRSTPAPAGRALAAVGPLTAGVPADFPVQVMVTGRAVRNLECPHLRLSKQACAAGSLPRLRVNRVLPWRTASVIVQLDLPRP